MRERRLAQPADREARGRDAHLRRRAVLTDAVDELDGVPRLSAPFARQLLQARAANAHDGELGGDEHSVDQDETDDDQDREDQLRSGHRVLTPSCLARAQTQLPFPSTMMRTRP